MDTATPRVSAAARWIVARLGGSPGGGRAAGTSPDLSFFLVAEDSIQTHYTQSTLLDDHTSDLPIPMMTR